MPPIATIQGIRPNCSDVPLAAKSGDAWGIPVGPRVAVLPVAAWSGRAAWCFTCRHRASALLQGPLFEINRKKYFNQTMKFEGLGKIT